MVSTAFLRDMDHTKGCACAIEDILRNHRCSYALIGRLLNFSEEKSVASALILHAGIVNLELCEGSRLLGRGS